MWPSRAPRAGCPASCATACGGRSRTRGSAWSPSATGRCARTVAVVGGRLENPSPPRPDDLFGERTRAQRLDAPAPLNQQQDRLRVFRGTDRLFGDFSRLEVSDLAARRRPAAERRGPRGGGPPGVRGLPLRQGHRDPPRKPPVGAPAGRGHARRGGATDHGEHLANAPRASLGSRRMTRMLLAAGAVLLLLVAGCRCLQGAGQGGPAEEARLGHRGVRPHRDGEEAQGAGEEGDRGAVAHVRLRHPAHEGVALRPLAAVQAHLAGGREGHAGVPGLSCLRQHLHRAAEGPVHRHARQDGQARVQDQGLQALCGFVADDCQRRDLPGLHGLRRVRPERPEPHGFVIAMDAKTGKQKWRYKGMPFSPRHCCTTGSCTWAAGTEGARDPGQDRPQDLDARHGRAGEHVGGLFEGADLRGQPGRQRVRAEREDRQARLERQPGHRVLLRHADRQLRPRVHRLKRRHDVRLRPEERQAAVGQAAGLLHLLLGGGVRPQGLRRHLRRQVLCARRRHRRREVAALHAQCGARRAGGHARPGVRRHVRHMWGGGRSLRQDGVDSTTAFDAFNGKKVWFTRAGKYASPIVADQDRTYLIGRAHIYALETSGSKTKAARKERRAG